MRCRTEAASHANRSVGVAASDGRPSDAIAGGLANSNHDRQPVRTGWWHAGSVPNNT